jgi:hypothetical protein|tara:strand:- start:227 stop:631 length:405 start_codon:yes stop_codon:yes gene_type:complete
MNQDPTQWLRDEMRAMEERPGHRIDDLKSDTSMKELSEKVDNLEKERDRAQGSLSVIKWIGGVVTTILTGLIVYSLTTAPVPPPDYSRDIEMISESLEESRHEIDELYAAIFDLVNQAGPSMQQFLPPPIQGGK